MTCCSSGADERTGDDEGGEFYCGEDADGDEDDEEGARAAALERFDAILQIDAGRFADDDDEEDEQEEGEEAGMKP